MTSLENNQPQRRDSFLKTLLIALQSGLSAGLCLGFPAGIVFWLVLVNNSITSPVLAEVKDFFINNVEPGWLILLAGTVIWGFHLAKITEYHRWYLLSLAVTLGVFIGQLPMQNGKLDIAFQRFALPVHIRFAFVLGCAVFSVMICTGFALGLTLRNWKTSLILAGSSGFLSVAATMTVFLLMDHVGIRVGSGNYAMLKVTAVGIVTAAIIGGATLGVALRRYVMQWYHNVL